MPDALVVGDGGQRLEQCLVIFAHVIVRKRPATADPIPIQRSVGLLTLGTAVTCPTLKASLSPPHREDIGVNDLQLVNRGAQLNPLLTLWPRLISSLGTLHLAGQ